MRRTFGLCDETILAGLGPAGLGLICFALLCFTVLAVVLVSIALLLLAAVQRCSRTKCQFPREKSRKAKKIKRKKKIKKRQKDTNCRRPALTSSAYIGDVPFPAGAVSTYEQQRQQAVNTIVH